MMKKISLLLVLFSMLFLTACSQTKEVVVIEDEVEEVKIEVEEDVDWSEYSFRVNIKWWDWFSMILDIHNKDQKSLTEVVSMSEELDDMPFELNKMLVLWDTSYQQINKDWDLYWFSTPSDPEQEMFNLKNMSTIDMTNVKDKKTEEINGIVMECYYLNQENEWESKICLADGVFKYGTFEENWVTDEIVIENYTDSVKNSVFELPKDANVLSIQEMMQIFQ